MIVDGVEFYFPEDWKVSVYDDWRFYRKQFQNIINGQKGVDILAIHRRILWLIEVKDYRKYPRIKAIDLAEETAIKARDTLAGLMSAAVNAMNEEKNFAANCLKAVRIRVVLQLEQPHKHSRLFPRAIKPIDVQQKIKKMIKAIDPHPVVNESIKPRPGIEWHTS